VGKIVALLVRVGIALEDAAGLLVAADEVIE
jgi:hypothetical protein